MKIKNKIATLLAGFGLVTACSDDISSAYTVGVADNAIVLGAGIGEGGAGVATRANITSESHHGSHKTFTANTKLTLRVDGIWTNKADGTIPLGSISGGTVSQTATATIGDGINVNSETEATHNKVSFATGQQLYWDDYGTADPNNMGSGKGRDIGLTIYGAAVNDATASAPDIDGTTNGKKWDALAWNVGTATTGTVDQSNGWTAKDLLISNNVQVQKDNVPYATDGTFKFDSDPRTKLLEFTHAMSKITVRLIAKEGFPTNGTVGGTTNKFETAPEVILTSNEGTATTNTEWPYTSGTVNVEAKTVTSPTASAKVKMHQGTVPSDQTTTYTAIYDALVAPGSVFADASGDPAKYPVIARIKADDNIYYVTSEKIRAAITTKYGSGNENGFVTQPGVNYIIDVKINKTKIEVTATITDWDPITAETVTPVINVSGKVGVTGANGDLTAFDFYMRESTASSYTAYGSAEGPADGTTKWQFKDAGGNNTTLYWPTHSTHYHMRGVAPKATAIDASKQIVVANGAYNSTTSPSNLMIGEPEIDPEHKMCNNSDHTSVDMIANGICARNNTINLNFRYVMSQVEVKLKSTGIVGKDLVTIDANTTVEIVGGYKKARIQLDTREHDSYTDSDKPAGGKYQMNSRSLTTEETNDGIIKYVAHDIIVPQILTDDMKVRITVKNTDETYDVYEAQLNKIADSSSALIKEWKPGEHYVYTLDLKKTNIDVTATLKDWVPVTANEDVWF